MKSVGNELFGRSSSVRIRDQKWLHQFCRNRSVLTIQSRMTGTCVHIDLLLINISGMLSRPKVANISHVPMISEYRRHFDSNSIMSAQKWNKLCSYNVCCSYYNECEN